MYTEGGKDTWALLGLLAEHRALPLPRETAYAKLWPDLDPAGDRDTFWKPMRDARTRLVQALGGGQAGPQVIQKLGRSSYRVNAGFFTFDVWELRDALKAARMAGGADKVCALTSAVEKYVGTYLPGCDYEFARNAALALEREVVDALAQLADLSEPEAAVLHLERATCIDPTAEHLCRQRMEMNARLGRVAAVHHCYQELAHVLEGLQLRPASQTEEVYRRLTRT
ncbi:hypothetical protein GCM10010191_12740 [Actinomadura vinacea]|uniref:Bacterial transcriptional activator domain-containing protein n=1 Tax=Actinomadura vinacea TaxID=115336 RepID=A0ABN3IJL8_9ACTN